MHEIPDNEDLYFREVFEICRDQYNFYMTAFAEYTWNEIRIYILNHDIL